MSSVTSLAILAVIAAALWKLFRGYFVKSPLDNIPGPRPSSLLRGNLDDFFNRHAWDFHDSISENYGPVIKFHNAFGQKGLYVFDPKALNNIVVKDQMIFEEPRWFIQWNLMTLGPGLLSTLGDHHRKQRKLLNPVFSINHMRHMTPIFYRVIRQLENAVAAQVGDSQTEVNVLDWMTRTALELIGQGGLGYSFDPLVEVKRNTFGEALKEFLPTNFALQYWRMVWPHVGPYIPKAIRPLFAPLLPTPEMRKLKTIVDTMEEQANNIFHGKKVALEKGDDAVVHQIGEGKDIISILMRANMSASEEDKLPTEELIAQMATLVFAATDTTSNALARILHLLVDHQDVQDKVRAEIIEASPDGEDIPYDQLIELPYLDAVCRETMRLYPPVTVLSREARQDVVLPLSEPIQGVDGNTISEIPVPKDTMVMIGIRACNRNKAIWGDDALEWKPERWLAPLPDAVGNAHIPGVYANLMTFFGGGRSCIGFKFSQLEMKVVLAVMLRSFRFLPGDKEIYWNLAGVNYPTVGKDGKMAAMPLKMERIKA